MKIEAVQYNALYTLNVEEKIYIRQFTKHGDEKQSDELIWYENKDGFAIMIEDSNLVEKLEKTFNSILQ